MRAGREPRGVTPCVDCAPCTRPEEPRRRADARSSRRIAERGEARAQRGRPRLPRARGRNRRAPGRGTRRLRRRGRRSWSPARRGRSATPSSTRPTFRSELASWITARRRRVRRVRARARARTAPRPRARVRRVERRRPLEGRDRLVGDRGGERIHPRDEVSLVQLVERGPELVQPALPLGRPLRRRHGAFANRRDPIEHRQRSSTENVVGDRQPPPFRLPLAHWPSRGQLASCIESEDDLVRFLVAPMSEPAPLAHDEETALRQHTNRRGVVPRSASVKRTGCLQLQELS